MSFGAFLRVRKSHINQPVGDSANFQICIHWLLTHTICNVYFTARNREHGFLGMKNVAKTWTNRKDVCQDKSVCVPYLNFSVINMR